MAPSLQLCFGGGVLLGFVMLPALRHGTWVRVVTLVCHLNNCDLGLRACVWGGGAALSACPCGSFIGVAGRMVWHAYTIECRVEWVPLVAATVGCICQ
jgi:hypothetical protein